MNKIPPHISKNTEYLDSLEELKYYHQNPIGLTDHLGQSQSDRIYPK